MPFISIWSFIILHETLNVAACFVRSIGKKEFELVEEIKIKGINVAVISETKKKLKGTKMIGNYTMLYSGVSQKTRAQPGIALIINQKWTSRITNYSCQRPHNNCSPKNQQRAHNCNKSLCPGRR